ncbi:hypothetical protein EWW49_28545 [Pseudomonas syringae]|nr:hypothetical protein EWW49_28545 [Pseudomonas syringae]
MLCESGNEAMAARAKHVVVPGSPTFPVSALYMLTSYKSASPCDLSIASAAVPDYCPEVVAPL